MDLKKMRYLSLTGVLAVTGVAFMASSCGRRGDEIDDSKTQLYIKNYQGGYGNKWLYEAKTEYEALHANDSYESGKKGVQILITDQKNYPTPAEVKNNSEQIYFFEALDFNTFYAENVLADITKYVTGVNPYESGKTIESKLYDEQKSFFGVPKDGSTHYFALPHYQASFGITYNRTIFDKFNYYFVDGYESYQGSAKFIQDRSETKSAGPNGIKGDEDDGLPITYDDFFDLCDYMKTDGTIPFTYYQHGDYNYLGFLCCSLATRHDGKVRDMVNYTMDGEIEVAKMNPSGTDVMLNPDGSLATELVTVHPETEGINEGKGDGYEVQRIAGKYYGLSFLERLVKNRTNWECNLISDADTQFNVQKYFINSQFGRLPAYNEQANKPIAMMFEGDWWYSEASNTIANLPKEEFNQTNYGWMPLPKANTSVSNKNTTLDSISSMLFMKAGLSENIEALAGDFIQFMNTDASLRKFTTITNAIKALKYDLTQEDKAKLSSFGKSLWNIVSQSDTIYPVSRNAQYARYLSSSQLPRRYNHSNTLNFPTTEFKAKDNPPTAGTYLASMYKWYKDSVWKK